ncbi:UNVERIFIED_CONTAM: hypothetical protein FKN15_029051 [Acipenser sinensis]
MPRPKTPSNEVSRPKTHYYGTSTVSTTSYEVTTPKTPSNDVARPKTPSYGAPTATTPSYDMSRPKTPSNEVPRPKTPSYGITTTTIISYEVPRSKTPSNAVSSPKTVSHDIQRAETPTHELARATTPTSEIPPMSDNQQAKTPANEAPKPQTPSVQTQRAKTPVPETETTAAALVPEDSKSITPKIEVQPVHPLHKKPQAGDGLSQETAKVTETKADVTKEKTAEKVAPTSSEKDNHQANSFPKAEPLLKIPQKAKSLKSKFSGWSRLKKHLVVEPEEPKFPEPEPEPQPEPEKETLQKKDKEKNEEKPSPGENESESQDLEKHKDSRATRMWDAVLFNMFSAKECIKQQINNSKSEQTETKQEEKREFSSLIYRLPLLLYKPRFDARKLKEAASRPLAKITTVFEMSLLNRKNTEEEPKDFNRIAKGWELK